MKRFLFCTGKEPKIKDSILDFEYLVYQQEYLCYCLPKENGHDVWRGYAELTEKVDIIHIEGLLGIEKTDLIECYRAHGPRSEMYYRSTDIHNRAKGTNIFLYERVYEPPKIRLPPKQNEFKTAKEIEEEETKTKAPPKKIQKIEEKLKLYLPPGSKPMKNVYAEQYVLKSRHPDFMSKFRERVPTDAELTANRWGAIGPKPKDNRSKEYEEEYNRWKETGILEASDEVEIPRDPKADLMEKLPPGETNWGAYGKLPSAQPIPSSWDVIGKLNEDSGMFELDSA